MQESAVTAASDREGRQGNTLKLKHWRGFELDMQESGVTAASEREGVCPWFLGFFLLVGEGVFQFA